MNKTIKTVQTGIAITLNFMLFSFIASSQSVGINETGATPDNSALLDLNSTNKGFLITRVDTVDISSPAFGLMTLAPEDSCLYMHNGQTSGKKWISIGGVGHDCPCSITPPPPPTSFTCGDDFSDSRDNNTYSTIEIGSQCWMAENLAYLPSINEEGDGSLTSSKYYVYGYDGTDVATAKNEANYSTYGVMYNWTAAMNGSSSSGSNPSGVQGACPNGWHLPSDSEWCEMENTVEANTDASCNISGWRGTNTGKHLKTSSWNGDNTSGFSALPGGYRDTYGFFQNEGILGYWWSTTVDGTNPWYRSLRGTNTEAYRQNNFGKDWGFSVRCIRD